MKIIFIGGRDIHTLGGIENYMYNLATKLVQKGYTPIVYCESDVNRTEFVNGYKVIHQKSVGGRFLCKILLSYKATITSLWKEKEATIYHFNAWPPSLASWLVRLAGKKVILQGHGLEWKRTKYTPFQQRIMKGMEFLTAKWHQHILMVSREQTDYFRLYYGKRCQTIPTAVNLPTDLHPDFSNELRRLGLKSGGYFLYMGRLVQDKNPDVLIDAYIQSGLTNEMLVIAGDNPADIAYVNKLRRMTSGHPGILFTGAVYGLTKECLLSECLAFCIPSTLEGLPITLLEAMSYKRICIASDIPACREALGENGVWVEPENISELIRKLRYVMENQEELRTIGESSYLRVATYFTWERIVKQYIDYIEKISQ